MKSLLVEFIKNNPNDWEEKLNKMHILVKKMGTLAIFNYRIDADFFNPIVREARGIIIDLVNMRVVCRGFDKFFNYGEEYAARLDWNSGVRVQQKIDGSIMKVYHWNGKWQVATNSQVTANSAGVGVEKSGVSFKDVFDRAAENVNLNYSFLDKNKTYIFELISPENRNVVDYGNLTTIYHIGTRDNESGEEFVEDIGVPRPEEYPLYSLDECIAAAKILNKDHEAIKAEGYVCVDRDWRRIKVKSPQYVAMHHYLPGGEISNEKLLAIIEEGDLEEIFTYVPSLKPRVEAFLSARNKLAEDIQKYCERNKKEVENNNLSRKDWVTQHRDDSFFAFGVSFIFNHRELDLNKLGAKKLCAMINACGR